VKPRYLFLGGPLDGKRQELPRPGRWGDTVTANEFKGGALDGRLVQRTYHPVLIHGARFMLDERVSRTKAMRRLLKGYKP
jgi:hypothetical protein